MLEPQESAASKVFRIPHLLSAVIQYMGYQAMGDLAWYPTLLNCMLVNSSWEDEALRVFWKETQTSPGHLPYPTLERLLNASAERQQRFANHICRLTICDYGKRIPSTEKQDTYDPDDGDSDYEGSSLMGIGRLSFPRLESLIIPAPHIPKSNYSYSIPLKQFIQSNLRRLELVVCNANSFLISDPFLHQLEQGATGLCEIEVNVAVPQFALFDQEAKLSLKRMATFLESFQSTLEEFRWAIQATMSQTSFKILSSCPRLKILSSLEIQDSWVEDEDTAASAGFSHLKELGNCSISGPALQTLLPWFDKLENLRLYESGGSASLWTVIVKAQFAYLSSLKLLLHYDTILHANEILSVAYRHPQLQTFEVYSNSLGSNYYYPLMANGFNDSTIIELAKSLPKLKSLWLGCYDETQGLLGEDSLTSLGYHCPLLENCHLYANIGWRKILSEEFADIMWPRLKHLSLKFHDNEGKTFDTALQFEDVSELGNLLLQRMPAMRQVSARIDDHGQARNVSLASLHIASAKRREDDDRRARGRT